MPQHAILNRQTIQAVWFCPHDGVSNKSAGFILMVLRRVSYMAYTALIKYLLRSREPEYKENEL